MKKPVKRPAKPDARNEVGADPEPPAHVDEALTRYLATHAEAESEVRQPTHGQTDGEPEVVRTHRGDQAWAGGAKTNAPSTGPAAKGQGKHPFVRIRRQPNARGR